MTMLSQTAVTWPPKHDVFGVRVSAVTCDEACDAMLSAARQREPAVVSAFAVHALVEASMAPDLAKKANRFAIITPDGQPVRWALNWLHGAGLKRTLQGYELMWRLCQRAADEGVSIYLYGSSSETLAALAANLLRAFPALQIAGLESPPFRPLSAEEDAAMVRRVNASGAGLMFLGLGCPKQDYFAAEHADRIEAVQFCVGPPPIKKTLKPSHKKNTPEKTGPAIQILVAGAGGFIGGHLVADLLARGFTDIRAVDIKPFDEWYQVFDDVDNVTADLKDKEECRMACRGASRFTTSPPTWAAWASSKTTRPSACSRC